MMDTDRQLWLMKTLNRLNDLPTLADKVAALDELLRDAYEAGLEAGKWGQELD